jgi:transglutaminase-like putative cysteine protease
MLIHVGCQIGFELPQPAHAVLMVQLHPSRLPTVHRPERLELEPLLTREDYVDGFGNDCTRVSAPAGELTIRTDAVVEDSGLPDLQVPNARQHDVGELPHHALVFLLPSRYCEVDSELKDLSWKLFGHVTPGWPRVQAICDYVFSHVRFDYMLARNTRTAWDVYKEQVGVCRDFMHLAITFCRCLNIPARYCTGYLGDIGVPPAASPMDFSAWFEAYVGGQWYSFDARNNTPRIGRVLVARGRDAADVALTTIFGQNTLKSFRVWTDEIIAGTSPAQASVS